jgi:hypothetical protein
MRFCPKSTTKNAKIAIHSLRGENICGNTGIFMQFIYVQPQKANPSPPFIHEGAAFILSFYPESYT